VTVKEAAKRLEISPSLVYLLISEGKLRCVRHGIGRGVIRITEEQLEQYIRQAEGGSAAARQPLKWIR
jgi:excisionase family DNA binding protein